MKNQKTAKLAALLSLMGLIQVSTAQADDPSFTPIENLPPEQRLEISKTLNDIAKEFSIDWDEIIIGVNDSGQITFINKKELILQATGGFSCLSAVRAEEDRK